MTQERQGLYEHPTNPKLVCCAGAKAVRETEKALLCQVDGMEVWIPKSQIDDESEVWTEGTEGTLVVTAWFAKEKGWD